MVCVNFFFRFGCLNILGSVFKFERMLMVSIRGSLLVTQIPSINAFQVLFGSLTYGD